MHLFYTPNINLESDTYVLSPEESKHCTLVLRMKAGDRIELVDGKGAYCQAQIVHIHKNNTEVAILSKQYHYNKRPFHLTLAIAPTKNMDRLEWFIEKSTEIGIDRIIPIKCRYSERKELKTERLYRVLVAAMKQSQKAYLPQLDELTPIETILRASNPPEKYIAHCYPGEKQSLSQLYTAPKDALILIGPEGDFSPEEVQEALNHQFHPITLGTSRLRTETAGLVACHSLNLLNNL